MTVEHDLKKQLAKKYNVNLGQIEEIISSQSAFIAEVMSRKADRENYKFPSVRVPGLGVFYCPDYLVRKFKEIDQKKAKNETI